MSKPIKAMFNISHYTIGKKQYSECLLVFGKNSFYVSSDTLTNNKQTVLERLKMQHLGIDCLVVTTE